MIGAVQTLGARLRSPQFRSVGLTAGAGWASRIVAAVAQLFAIRVLTQMLGVDGYGAFAVVTGLVGWFALADLGLGAALQNYVAGERVAGRSPVAAIRTVVLFLAGVMGLLSLIWLLTAGWAGRALLSRFDTVRSDDAARAFLAYAVLATGTGIGQIASRICFAEHRGYVGHAMTSGAIVLGVLGLVGLQQAGGPPSLVWSVIVYQSPAWLVPSAFFFLYLRERGRARLSFDFSLLRHLWRQGRFFLLFNTLAALVLFVDYIILSQTIAGPGVAVYAIFAKLFALAFFVFSSVLQAYWPVTAELFHRRDTRAIWPIARNSIAFGIVVVLGAGLVFALSRGLVARLVAPGSNIDLPLALIPFFVGYWLVRVWCDTFAMLVQSAGRAVVLCWIVPVQAALNLVFGYWGAAHYGLPGLLVGMTTSFVLTVGWALPTYVARLCRSSELTPLVPKVAP